MLEPRFFEFPRASRLPLRAREGPPAESALSPLRDEEGEEIVTAVLCWAALSGHVLSRADREALSGRVRAGERPAHSRGRLLREMREAEGAEAGFSKRADRWPVAA